MRRRIQSEEDGKTNTLGKNLFLADYNFGISAHKYYELLVWKNILMVYYFVVTWYWEAWQNLVYLLGWMGWLFT